MGYIIRTSEVSPGGGKTIGGDSEVAQTSINLGDDGEAVDLDEKKSTLLKLTEETPEARKKRGSSGVRFRAAVFENKKKRLLDRLKESEADE